MVARWPGSTPLCLRGAEGFPGSTPTNAHDDEWRLEESWTVGRVRGRLREDWGRGPGTRLEWAARKEGRKEGRKAKAPRRTPLLLHPGQSRIIPGYSGPLMDIPGHPRSSQVIQVLFPSDFPLVTSLFLSFLFFFFFSVENAPVSRGRLLVAHRLCPRCHGDIQGSHWFHRPCHSLGLCILPPLFFVGSIYLSLSLPLCVPWLLLVLLLLMVLLPAEELCQGRAGGCGG